MMRHGGALDVARACFPRAPEPWIDLSTGINPYPYPMPDLDPEVWQRLPEAAALADLEHAAARCYGCPAQARIVAAPGTQAIIQQLPALLAARDVRILAPAYGEYERVFLAAGANVRMAGNLAALEGADVAILVNPNNPDGRLLAPGRLADLSPNVGTLVIDAAFADALAPGTPVLAPLPMQGVIILRSFGKFYGLAGLRLGFAMGDEGFAARLREALGPWAVSGPAIAAGTAALGDEAWARHTREKLAATAARLDATLHAAGLEILGGTPLFRLARHPRAGALFSALAGAGILVRPFTQDPDWLRFGLPASAEAWDRLAQVLSRFCQYR